MLHGREDRENEPDGKEEREAPIEREKKERGEGGPSSLLLTLYPPSSLPLVSLSLLVEKDA